FSIENYRELLASKLAKDAIVNSIITSIGGTLLALPLGYLAAEVIHRRRGGRFTYLTVETLIMLPLGIPSIVFGAGVLFVYTRPPLVLYGTMWVLLLVYATIMLPYTTRLVLAARQGMGNQYE